MQFSLMYFASTPSGPGAGEHDPYGLLLDGARFADQAGFSAVWTPERHFHDFGGAFPNPALTSAALATITDRIGLRAGSVVMPLHHPVRVAEEWSVVDNLSGGRVGIAAASGWVARDFVIAPDRFADRRAAMRRSIDTVQRLWRGEQVAFRDGEGKEVKVSLQPRPVQAELPIWVTSSGNVETVEFAGRIGASVLTHLLGQGVPDVAAASGAYRRSFEQHAPAGREPLMTLMLHTYLDDDAERAHATARGPLGEYLRSSLNLFTKAAEAGESVEVMVDRAVDRYLANGSLIGSVESCRPLLSMLRRVGVGEIACLIDFGLDHETVMSGLERLAELAATP